MYQKKSMSPKVSQVSKGFHFGPKKRDRGKILFEVVVPEDAFRGNDAETRGATYRAKEPSTTSIEDPTRMMEVR